MEDRKELGRRRGSVAASSSGDVALAGALFLGFASLAWILRQGPTWSDGRDLIQAFDAGAWKYHHVLYFPAAHLLRAVSTLVLPLGARASLELLSAASTALALALVYRSSRALGTSRSAALAAALLLGSAPGVWFYATTVEVHALQLAAAAACTAWIARAESARTSGRDALVPALLFCLLFGTHVSAAFCLPAVVLVVLGGPGPRRVPVRLAPAIVALVCMAILWRLVNPRGASTLVDGACAGLLSRWSTALAWEELVAPAGLLYALGLASWIARLRSPGRRASPALAALFVLVATLVPFAMTIPFRERGAYFTWALPGLALCAARVLEKLGRLRMVVATAALGVHAAWAHAEVRAWRDEYRGHEWLPILSAASARRTLVVCLDAREWDAIRNHSDVEVVHASPLVLDEPERFLPLLFRVIDRAAASERTIVMTPAFHAALFETSAPAPAAVAARLIERYGRPEPSPEPGCWVIGTQGAR